MKKKSKYTYDNKMSLSLNNYKIKILKYHDCITVSLKKNWEF